MTIVSVNNLFKRFGNKEVLKGVNLVFEEGKVYGLFGKNGAGKTTLIKIILGIIFPSNGNVFIFGKEPRSGGLREIGYLSENLAGYFDLSAYDNIDIIAKMQGIKLRREEIFEILETVNLGEAAMKKVKDFSLGMKRRLQLAFAFCVGEKKLILLDEPTNGLDIEGIFWFKNRIKEMKEERDKTIIISTHAFEEIESVIDEFIIIHRGEVKKKASVYDLEIKNKRFVKINNEDVERFLELMNLLELNYTRISSTEFIVEENMKANLLEEIVKKGIKLQRFETYKETIKNIFETVTKE
ncbi:ABC transporter ATP-binding protein [Caldicellulosiruptor acetigenus]|uniref:ABC transporter related protein n=1 Tax=Caldicellulosiruptor acetigenus 6A TaxID=632516 RepID=G2PYI0_9FIRM|nr:ABC transporter ATP-binding protein [Caldicellulosiruptor acetigenus]AEM74030.1 ABC transporter related protein [Caldicellulosiruptor acetigenus 6A]